MNTSNATTGRPPLDGLLVLDLSRVLAAPTCAMHLGDLGATVIKVEHPARGDDTRHWGPPFFEGEAAYYLSANRNKLSIAVDLKTEEGRRIVRDIAQKADIVLENFRRGTLDKMGLGADDLTKLNPRLIYASVSGYGRSGPRADDPGYDFVIQAESGLMSITGDPDGEPVKVGVPISDLISGLTLTQAVLAALHARDRDGVGQVIDLSLLDAQLAVMANIASGTLVSGEDAGRYGNAHPNIVPYQTFNGSDGAFVLAVGNDLQFGKLCADVLDRPEWAADERFKTNQARVRNRDALVPMLAEAFAARTAGEWLELIKAAGIPAGKVRSMKEALAAPEIAARGMVVPVDHPNGDGLEIVHSPVRLSRTPIRETKAPPLLGGDTDLVLKEVLGLDETRIAELRAAGAIGA